jgi:hypothetical protein
VDYQAESCLRAVGVTHLPSLTVDEAMTKRWFFHGSDARNILAALETRVDVCRPRPNEQVMDQLLRVIATPLRKALGYVSPCSYDDVVNSYHVPRKRVRYGRARDELARAGYTKPDRGTIKVFVKKEAVAFSDSKIEPDPRAIQFRDAETTLILMTVIKPIEHKLYRMRGVAGLPPTRVMTKGMTPVEIAQHLVFRKQVHKWSFLYGFDASRFDSSVSPPMLALEHFFWKWKQTNPLFMEALGYQKVNKGRAYTVEGKITYHVRGTRMSGDANTAAGNNLLMLVMLMAFGCHISGDWDWEGKNAGKDYDFILDGDDSLFMTNIPISEPTLDRFFADFGFKMKFEYKTSQPEQATFCQRRLVEISPGEYNMIRDPEKFLSKIMVNVHFTERRARPKMLYTIAQGELSQCQGVPVLQAFAERLKEVCSPLIKSKTKLVKNFEFDKQAYRYIAGWREAQAHLVSQCARESFAKAWNIEPARQLAIEAEIRLWTPDIMGPEERGLDISDGWRFDWLRHETAIPFSARGSTH